MDIASLVTPSLAPLWLGFLLGVRHAADPDHVVAVSAIAARTRALGPAIRLGAAWGLGLVSGAIAVERCGTLDAWGKALTYISGQPIQFLAAGEVVMASSYTSRPFFARRQENKNYQVVWNESIYAIDFWVVLKGSPNNDNAMRLVEFMTRPEQQRPYPGLAGSSPTNLEAIKGVEKDISVLTAGDPANMAQAIPIDSDYWTDNADQLTQRFNAWASK